MNCVDYYICYFELNRDIFHHTKTPDVSSHKHLTYTHKQVLLLLGELLSTNIISTQRFLALMEPRVLGLPCLSFSLAISCHVSINLVIEDMWRKSGLNLPGQQRRVGGQGGSSVAQKL